MIQARSHDEHPFKKITGHADRREGMVMRLLMCMMFVASVSPLPCAQEVRDRGMESKIIALERIGKLQAFQVKDIKTLDSILDEDFVCVDEQGDVMTKPQVLSFVQSADSLNFLADGMTAKLHGDAAVVTGLFRLTGTTKGKPFLREGRFVDTWIRRKSGWVTIASLWTPAM
jgi:ketosteroid isomerase-like protein